MIGVRCRDRGVSASCDTGPKSSHIYGRNKIQQALIVNVSGKVGFIWQPQRLTYECWHSTVVCILRRAFSQSISVCSVLRGKLNFWRGHHRGPWLPVMECQMQIRIELSSPQIAALHRMQRSSDMRTGACLLSMHCPEQTQLRNHQRPQSLPPEHRCTNPKCLGNVSVGRGREAVISR